MYETRSILVVCTELHVLEVLEVLERVKGKGEMKPSTLIEVIDAAHLSYYVSGDFEQRGGMMLVGPPETLRTTVIQLALKPHPDALRISDVNMNSLLGLKEGFTSGRYSTLGFLDYQKIYERHKSSASNVEGTLRQLMEEGFTRNPHEDPTMASTEARAFVVAAVTEAFYSRHNKEWRDSGYLRRWLICLMHIDSRNKAKITHAIERWKKLEFDGFLRKSPVNSIACDLTAEENAYCKWLVREQPSQATPFALIKKIFTILKWKYKNFRDVKRILDDFAPCLLNTGGASLELKE
jgi:hypothetical protein